MTDQINAIKVASKLTNTHIPVTRDTSLWANNFEHKTNFNSDKTSVRARRNGKTKTWKRNDRFSIPVKYGLKECFYITQNNCIDWYIVN